jgi:hypothetical protein
LRRNFKNIKTTLQSSLKLKKLRKTKVKRKTIIIILTMKVTCKGNSNSIEIKKSQRKYLQLKKSKQKMMRNLMIFKTNSMNHTRKESIKVRNQKRKRLLRKLGILNLVQLKLHQKRKMMTSLIKKKRKPKMRPKPIVLLQPRPKMPFLLRLLRPNKMILSQLQQGIKLNLVIYLEHQKNQHRALNQLNLQNHLILVQGQLLVLEQWVEWEEWAVWEEWVAWVAWVAWAAWVAWVEICLQKTCSELNQQEACLEELHLPTQVQLATKRNDERQNFLKSL